MTTIDKIYEDYDEYVEYCKSVHELPVRLTEGFYDDWERLKELHRNDLEE